MGAVSCLAGWNAHVGVIIEVAVGLGVIVAVVVGTAVRLGEGDGCKVAWITGGVAFGTVQPAKKPMTRNSMAVLWR